MIVVGGVVLVCFHAGNRAGFVGGEFNALFEPASSVATINLDCQYGSCSHTSYFKVKNHLALLVSVYLEQ